MHVNDLSYAMFVYFDGKQRIVTKQNFRSDLDPHDIEDWPCCYIFPNIFASWRFVGNISIPCCAG